MTIAARDRAGETYVMGRRIPRDHQFLQDGQSVQDGARAIV